jgi:hypothetical protein
MDCPQCGARTVVDDKRGPFRQRRCTNLVCAMSFTTREHIIPRHGRDFCVRTRAIKIGAIINPASAQVNSSVASHSRPITANVGPEIEAAA